MANNVRIGTQVTGVAKSSSDLDRLKDKFTNLQKQGAKPLLAGAAAGVTVGALNLVGNAIGHVTDFLGDAAQAAMEEEHSVSQLNTSLRANVAGWDGTTDAIERTIKARMALGFSDDEQRNALTKLVAATHDVNKALAVESVAMDLARFKNISLADASDALTKVEAGSYRILKSLGISLKDGATQTEALAAVEQIAAGQAAAYADTLEGRVVVAQVKAREAEEKFGRGLAELEATILPPVADEISYLADTLDGLSYKFTHLGDVVPKDELAGTVGPFFTLGTTMNDDAEAADNLSRNMLILSEREDSTAKAATNLGRETQMGAGHIAALSSSFRIAQMEAEGLDKDIGDLADTIENDLFGKAINAGHEAELKQNIKDLEKQRSEVKKNSPEWKILTGEIAQNRQDLFKLHLEEAEKEGPQAVIAFLKRQKQLFGDTDGAIQQMIDDEKRLINVNGRLAASMPETNLGPKNVAHKHAAGGYAPRGEVSLVGEEGPELFVSPGGKVISHQQSIAAMAGGSGGDMVGGGGLTIIVQGVSVMTPGSAEELARTLGPIVTRYQQQRGLLGGARAF